MKKLICCVTQCWLCKPVKSAIVFLTMNEFVSMAQRVAVARMLYNDEKYTDITYKTGASSATISRVKRCVRYGADGYTLVLRRLTEKTDKK